MLKPIIAVDIDDVMSQTAKTILEFSNKTWGHQHTHDDFNEHLQDMWQVDKEEAKIRWSAYLNSGLIATYDVVPTAKEVLVKLKEKFQLVAVTSRRDSLMEVTHQWLNTSYPGVIDEVVPAGIYGRNLPDSHKLTKAGVLQKIGARYLIDDQPKHCVGADEVGVTAILYGGYPWGLKGDVPISVVRCDTWKEIEEYFDGQPGS